MAANVENMSGIKICPRWSLARREAGLLISGEAMKAWVACLATDNPLLLPKPWQ
ncbi:hypothetical protein AA11825_1635 [Acetobacter pomorum DSM 11825]|nr:hypothetical protein AA11825_1635 [Acetobacter pomorum DSM 11825]